MSKAFAGETDSGASRYENGDAAVLGLAGWLSLAATPAFAIMALFAGVLGGGRSDMLCMSAREASPLAGTLSGMVPMYLLMGAFHSAPWLKLITGRLAGILRSGRT